jgi:hypothetical protein
MVVPNIKEFLVDASIEQNYPERSEVKIQGGISNKRYRVCPAPATESDLLISI